MLRKVRWGSRYNMGQIDAGGSSENVQLNGENDNESHCK